MKLSLLATINVMNTPDSAEITAYIQHAGSVRMLALYPFPPELFELGGRERIYFVFQRLLYRDTEANL